MEGIGRLLGMLAVTVGILALAYYATRLIGRLGLPNGRFSGGRQQMQVLEQLTVGKDQKLLVVRLQEHVLLIGASAGAMTVLRELTAEEAAAFTVPAPDGQPPAPSFKEAVLAALRKDHK